MNQEQRVFFRFDVSIPVYIELQEADKSCFQVDREQLVDAQTELDLAERSEQLQTLFEEPIYVENGGVALFKEFNQRLEFLAWILDFIVLGVNPKESEEFRHEFTQRHLAQSHYKSPESKGGSKVVALLQQFYDRIDKAISELLTVIEKSVSGKVFLFPEPVTTPFNSAEYLPNLLLSAEQGNWLASVIEHLIFKFNASEAQLNRLKAIYHALADSNACPITQVNLAAGGFSLLLKEDYVQGDAICVLFLIEEQFVFAQAECAYAEPEKAGSPLKRIAFRFTQIAAEDEAYIVRYLMEKELEQRASDDD